MLLAFNFLLSFVFISNEYSNPNLIGVSQSLSQFSAAFLIRFLHIVQLFSSKDSFVIKK